jgi:hypothetical protein
MTTRDGGGSHLILAGGAGSGGGVEMGGQGAVAPVASWGLAASVVKGKCQRHGPVSSCQPDLIGWPSGW